MVLYNLRIDLPREKSDEIREALPSQSLDFMVFEIAEETKKPHFHIVLNLLSVDPKALRQKFMRRFELGSYAISIAKVKDEDKNYRYLVKGNDIIFHSMNELRLEHYRQENRKVVEEIKEKMKKKKLPFSKQLIADYSPIDGSIMERLEHIELYILRQCRKWQECYVSMSMERYTNGILVYHYPEYNQRLKKNYADKHYKKYFLD